MTGPCTPPRDSKTGRARPGAPPNRRQTAPPAPAQPPGVWCRKSQTTGRAGRPGAGRAGWRTGWTRRRPQRRRRPCPRRRPGCPRRRRPRPPRGLGGGGAGAGGGPPRPRPRSAGGGGPRPSPPPPAWAWTTGSPPPWPRRPGRRRRRHRPRHRRPGRRRGWSLERGRGEEVGRERKKKATSGPEEDKSKKGTRAGGGRTTDIDAGSCSTACTASPARPLALKSRRRGDAPAPAAVSERGGANSARSPPPPHSIFTHRAARPRMRPGWGGWTRTGWAGGRAPCGG